MLDIKIFLFVYVGTLILLDVLFYIFLKYKKKIPFKNYFDYLFDKEKKYEKYKEDTKK